MQYEHPAWDDIISFLPEAHVLQTIEWAQVKSHFGWSAIPKIWYQNNDIVAAAVILQREMKIPLIGKPLKLLYVPKGPLLKNWNDMNLVKDVIEDLKQIGRDFNALLIKIDADVEIGRGEHNDELWRLNLPRKTNEYLKNLDINQTGYRIIDYLSTSGWIFSKEQIQFRNTVISDLTADEDTLLRNMRQKTRYNIRLAEKKGVTIREGSKQDFPALYNLYTETAQRDGFIIRDYRYYETVWSIFLDGAEKGETLKKQSQYPNYWRFNRKNRPTALILIAEYDQQPIAGIILFVFQNKAWFIYGMSSSQHRDKMPNYLLHWKAMQILRQLGVKVYDWWGAPDQFIETDPMYGVYRFKMGFGGNVVRRIGAWDYPLHQTEYTFYQVILPKLLSVFRLKERIGLS